MTSARPDRPGLGIVLMMSCVATLSVMDGFSKSLIEDYHVVEIAFGRTFVQALILAPLFLRAGPSLLASATPRLQILRGAALFIATLLFVQGLAYLPVADTTALAFVSPLCVVVLSIVMLGERVDPLRWVGVIAGFVGVLVIIRPGSGVFGLAALWPISEALVWAFCLVVTRRIRNDPPLTTLFYGTALQLGLSCLFLPFVWRTPDGAALLQFVVTGVLWTIGQLMMIEAYRRAPASLISPFTYTQLFWSALVGLVGFGTFPDRWTWIGTAIIVASGLLVWWREQVVAARSLAPK